MHPIVICCEWACFLCISLYEMLPRARLLITLVFTTNLRKMLSNNELLSKTITFLRLPLIVGVVFIHTNLNDVNIGCHWFNNRCHMVCLWPTKGQIEMQCFIGKQLFLYLCLSWIVYCFVCQVLG